MKFRDISKRLTGFSTPLFGASWTPPVVDSECARGLVEYLEDRRVLYSPTEVELADHCVQSVLDIRRRLTDLLVTGGIEADLLDHIRAMRAAARQFVERAGVDPEDRHPDLMVIMQGRRAGLHDWRLNQALGELRGVFGVHLAQIAVKYGIDINPPLDSILPPEVDE